MVATLDLLRIRVRGEKPLRGTRVTMQERRVASLDLLRIRVS